MSDQIAKWICVGIGLAVIALFLYAFVMIIIGTIADRSVPRIKVYDKVKWYGDACPGDAGLGAYVPFGFLLGWLIEHQLVGEGFQVDEDLVAACAEFKSRVTTGPELYCDMLDGVLTDDDLNGEGNQFVKWYIKKYYGDFADTFCDGGEFDDLAASRSTTRGRITNEFAKSLIANTIPGSASRRRSAEQPSRR